MSKPSLNSSPAGLSPSSSKPLEEQLTEIEIRLRSIDERQAEWDARQAEFAELRRRCEDREQELDRVKAELKAAQKQLARHAGPSADTEHFAAGKLEFDAERQSFAEQKDAWESQKAAAQNRLDDRVAGLDALRVDLESQRAAWEKQRRQWEITREETAAAQAEEAQRLSALQAEIEALRVGSASREDAATAPETVNEIPSPVDESLPFEASGEAEDSEQSDALAAEPQEPVNATTTADESTTEDSDLNDTAENEVVANETAVKPSTEAPSRPKTEAPVSLAEILRKTGFKIDETDDEAGTNNRKVEETPRGGDSPVNITAPVARVRKTSHKPEDDVSIDDYMTRLLARSRGDAAPAAAAAPAVRPAPSPSRNPQPAPTYTPTKPEPARVSPAPAPQVAATVNPIEMGPRAAAPERGIDMRAMRQLANMSAKTAINRHESKQLTGTTRTKLAVTIIASVVGIVLLGLYFLNGAPVVTVAVAVASFAVAALWGTNYVVLCKKMMGVRMAYLERHLKAGEEAPHEKAPEATKAVEAPQAQEAPKLSAEAPTAANG